MKGAEELLWNELPRPPDPALGNETVSGAMTEPNCRNATSLAQSSTDNYRQGNQTLGRACDAVTILAQDCIKEVEEDMQKHLDIEVETIASETIANGTPDVEADDKSNGKTEEITFRSCRGRQNFALLLMSC